MSEDSNVVASVVLVRVTYGPWLEPLTKPVPLIVTEVFTAAPRLSVVGDVVEIVGAALTVNADARAAEVPFESVTVRLYEPGTVADVDEKFAVNAVADDSETPVKVTPGAFVVTVTVPLLKAKPVAPVILS